MGLGRRTKERDEVVWKGAFEGGIDGRISLCLAATLGFNGLHTDAGLL